LPFELQRRWLRYATAIEEDGLEASFSDLVRFVKDEALVVNSSYGRIFKERHHRREAKVSMHSTAVEGVKAYENVSKCSYCSGSHRLHTCASFKRVPPPQRSVHVNQQRLCFNCLKAGHNSKRCYSKPFCAVAGCGRKHHTLLHEQFQQVRRPVANQNPTSTASENQAAETPTEPEVKCNGIKSSSLVYFNIVPVRVRCDDREILVNAFLDQGSSATLCDQRLLEVLNVPSKEITFGLTTVGATQRMKGKRARLSVAPVVEDKFIDLPNVITVNALPMRRNPRLSPQDTFFQKIAPSKDFLAVQEFLVF